ncbi:hypothetical protein PCASD_03770 [Puccinia coronata f. sp. avenae]|uniref:Uncharacterized protein n=1 Tax=Puccinia coronata f. sp. avenae TaxID=200324 RepID=A0A2N5V8F9_9BASI|nr:hypothetical protein PCASD_03770 [Puccinia coronata f. sp. avenae]
MLPTSKSPKDERLSAEDDPRLAAWLRKTYDHGTAEYFLRQGNHRREPQFFIDLANDKKAPAYLLIQQFNYEAGKKHWKKSTRQTTKDLIDEVMKQIKQLSGLPELDLAKKAELLACTKALAEITGASKPTGISHLERANLEHIVARWPQEFRQSSEPESFDNAMGILPLLYDVLTRM